MPEFSMLGRSSPSCPKEEKISLFSEGGAVTLLILALQVMYAELEKGHLHKGDQTYYGLLRLTVFVCCSFTFEPNLATLPRLA